MRETFVMNTFRNRSTQKPEEPLLSLLRIIAKNVVEHLNARKQEQATNDSKKPE